MSWIGASRFQKYKKRRGRRHLLQNYPVTFKHGVLENQALMIFQLAMASFYRILVPIGPCLIFGWYAVLVGGFNPSEKYESVGMIIPNIWKKKVPNHQPEWYFCVGHRSTSSKFRSFTIHWQLMANCPWTIRILRYLRVEYNMLPFISLAKTCQK